MEMEQKKETNTLAGFLMSGLGLDVLVLSQMIHSGLGQYLISVKVVLTTTLVRGMAIEPMR